MVQQMPSIPGVGRLRGGFDSNFLLIEMLDRPNGKPDNNVALKVYERLAEQKGVVVRFRGKEHGCMGCLRITVGTEKEVDRFLKELKVVLQSIYDEATPSTNGVSETQKSEANAVVS